MESTGKYFVRKNQSTQNTILLSTLRNTTTELSQSTILRFSSCDRSSTEEFYDKTWYKKEMQLMEGYSMLPK